MLSETGRIVQFFSIKCDVQLVWRDGPHWLEFNAIYRANCINLAILSVSFVGIFLILLWCPRRCWATLWRCCNSHNESSLGRFLRGFIGCISTALWGDSSGGSTQISRRPSTGSCSLALPAKRSVKTNHQKTSADTQNWIAVVKRAVRPRGGPSGSLHVLPLPFNSIRSPPPVHQLASSAKHFFPYLHYLVDCKSLGCSLFCAFSSESALTWIVLYCFCVLFSRSPLPSVWFCWLNVSSVVLFVGWLLAGCWLDAERVMADWIHFSGGDLLWLGFQLKLALFLRWPLFDTLQSWWIVVLVGCDSGRVNLLTEQEGAIDPLDWSCKQQQPNGVVDAFLGECSMRTLMNSWSFQGPIDAMNQFEAFHLDSTVWLLASRRFDFRLDSVGPSRLKGTSFPWLQQSTSTVRNWWLNGD